MATYWHLCVYSGSVAAGGTNVDLPFVNDSILTRQNNHAILPDDGRLLLAFGQGVGMTRARLNTPAARYVGLPSVQPVNNGADPLLFPAINDYSEGPLTIPKADEIAFESTSNDAGAQTHYVGAVFQFANRPVPPGQKYRLRGTASITASAGTWVNGSITMDTVLPRGNYMLVGLNVVGANLFCARLIFPGASYRPGVYCQTANTSIPWPGFRDGRLGCYGDFDSVNTPNLEILSDGANTSQEVYMDVVRMGPAGF